MKLTEECIEQIANYMADSLEDHLDTVFWDGSAQVLNEYNVDHTDAGAISDEDCEAIVLKARAVFAVRR